MKWLFRWAFRLALLLVVLVVVLLLSLDSILRAAAEKEIRLKTGMDVRIGNLSVGLLLPVVALEKVKIYNTADFGGSPLVDMPELNIEYDWRELWHRRLHCKLVRVTLAEVNIVQNRNGRFNFNFMATNATATPAPASPGKAGTQLKFTGIDTLNLTFTRMTGLKMNDPKKIRTLDLGIRNAIIPGIRDEQDLALQLGDQIMKHGGLGLISFFGEKP